MNGCSTIARSEKLTASPRPRRHLFDQIVHLLLGDRQPRGLASVAVMLAEVSTRKMKRFVAETACLRQLGRRQARISSSNKQQLQEQQQVLPQPLPETVDVQVLDRAVPQDRCWAPPAVGGGASGSRAATIAGGIEPQQQPLPARSSMLEREIAHRTSPRCRR